MAHPSEHSAAHPERRGINSTTGSFSLAIDDGPFEEFFDDIPLSRLGKAKLLLVATGSPWAQVINHGFFKEYQIINHIVHY